MPITNTRGHLSRRIRVVRRGYFGLAIPIFLEAILSLATGTGSRRVRYVIIRAPRYTVHLGKYTIPDFTTV